MTLSVLRDELALLKNSNKANILAGFFKTGRGDYGEGDVFLGLTVPQSRKIAQKYRNLPFADNATLLESKIHEERLIALLMLVHNFQRGDTATKDKIYKFYLRHTKYVNNWDLVDLSAPKIVGEYLRDKPRDILYKLAKSKNLWERRIAILATLLFIVKAKEFVDTFKISEMLLNDTHDLIHKAVGWMLREVGKRVSEKTLKSFLSKYYRQMPRTMLRYAVERLPESKKRAYLEGNIE